MRIATLLAQFLYTHNRLDLPGMGSFLMSENISFETNTRVAVSPELIPYISSQTGKIRALAAADLDSHLELAQQFMNIGKPFVFEGIGTLVKVRSGEFEFIPGELHEVMKEQPVKEAPVITEEAPTDYKSVFYPEKKRTRWKKPVAVILLVAGLALAIWGGYTVYKRTMAGKDKPIENKNETTITEPVKDSIPFIKDTTVPVQNLTVAPTGSFRFVLEKSPAGRAFARFSQLKTFQWNVQMETRDSLSYTIFMLLPARVADTTRMIDSLSLLTGRKVYIE